MKSIALTWGGSLALTALVISGCSGGGSASTSDLQTGTVVDGNISGLSYECRKSTGELDTTGTTGMGGTFLIRLETAAHLKLVT